MVHGNPEAINKSKWFNKCFIFDLFCLLRLADADHGPWDSSIPLHHPIFDLSQRFKYCCGRLYITVSNTVFKRALVVLRSLCICIGVRDLLLKSSRLYIHNYFLIARIKSHAYLAIIIPDEIPFRTPC